MFWRRRMSPVISAHPLDSHQILVVSLEEIATFVIVMC